MNFIKSSRKKVKKRMIAMFTALTVLVSGVTLHQYKQGEENDLVQMGIEQDHLPLEKDPVFDIENPMDDMDEIWDLHIGDTEYKLDKDSTISKKQDKKDTLSFFFQKTNDFSSIEDVPVLPDNIVNNGENQPGEDVECNHDYQVKTKDVINNMDGSHTITTVSVCIKCKEEITDEKTENCDYNSTPTYDPIYTGSFAITNTHNEISACLVCGDEKKEEKSCVSDGNKQYIKYLSQIYEYAICILCGNKSDQVPHYDHHMGNWEYYDEKLHKRYCGCIEAREEAPHNYELKENGTVKVCDDCKHEEIVPPHTHPQKYNTFWELMLSGTISKYPYGTPDLKGHPNPSKDTYCLKIIYQCPPCGTPYVVTYGHDFKLQSDGVTYKCDNACGISYTLGSSKQISLPEEGASFVSDLGVEEKVDVSIEKNQNEDVVSIDQGQKENVVSIENSLYSDDSSKQNTSNLLENVSTDVTSSLKEETYDEEKGKQLVLTQN